MKQIRSPFLIHQDFLSPKMCDEIISANRIPSITPDNASQDSGKTEKHLLTLKVPLWEMLTDDGVKTEVEERYSANVAKFEVPVLQHYPQNDAVQYAEPPGCPAAKYVRRKWVKTKDADLVGYIWLKDFNDSMPLDREFEIYGGRLEFPQFDFSLVPQRGTLVIFPATPNFITLVSPIFVGDLYQIRFLMKLAPKDESSWFYQPSDFPGTYQEWFNQYV